MKEPKEQFADVTVQRLATVYAEALWNAAGADINGVMEEIDSLLDDVFQGESELRGQLEALLAGAAVGRKARKQAIEKAFKGRASDVFYHFMLVLNDQDRLSLIRPIRRALHQLSDERNRRIRVHVYAAVGLSEEFQARIRSDIAERFKLEPVLEMHEDKSLLGGMKIRIGDRVMDATVRTRIDNLRNQLIAKGSHEIQSQRDRFSSAE